MQGGFDAWKGLISKAAPDQGLFLIEGNERMEDLISLAYGLEEGNSHYYSILSGKSITPDIAEVFQVLADQEEKHKLHIWEMYKVLHGGHVDKKDFEKNIVADVLENGKTSDQMLIEFPQSFHSLQEVFDFSMSLETDSLDLYLRLAQKTPDNEAGDLFNSLAQEEKKHLEYLGKLYRENLA
jgi:rubrerythrin